MSVVSDRVQFSIVWLTSAISYLPTIMLLRRGAIDPNLVFVSRYFAQTVLYTVVFLSVPGGIFVAGWLLFDWEWSLRRYMAVSLLVIPPVSYLWSTISLGVFQLSLMIAITLFGAIGVVASHLFTEESSSGQIRVHSDGVQTLVVSSVIIFIVFLAFTVVGVPIPSIEWVNRHMREGEVLFTPILLYPLFSLALGSYVALYWYLFDWDSSIGRVVATSIPSFVGAVVLMLIFSDVQPHLPVIGFVPVIVFGAVLNFTWSPAEGRQSSTTTEKPQTPVQPVPNADSEPDGEQFESTDYDRNTRPRHESQENVSVDMDLEQTETRVGPPEEIPSIPDIPVDYEAIEDRQHIGSGGNADVFRSQVPTSHGEIPVAIKEPRIHGTLHEDDLERFLDEAEMWDKLDRHDHIVGVVDYGSVPLPWIAMEYMDGGHLGELAGEMDTTQALWTAFVVTEGIYHAHRQGVAHLDLKPANILFQTVENAWDVPKVADWGLSKQLLEHSKSVEGFSPQYAAPEQFDESYGTTDNVTDVYQLGAVFYKLFTGAPPFEGEAARVMHNTLHEQPTPPSDTANVSSPIDEVLLKALAKEKPDRYESVLYLRDELQNLYRETQTRS